MIRMLITAMACLIVISHANMGFAQQPPTPVPIPRELSPEVVGRLDEHRRGVMGARDALIADIVANRKRCVVDDDKATSALRKECSDWNTRLGVQWNEYDSRVTRFDRLVRVERAEHRHVVALRGLESGLNAFTKEKYGDLLTFIADEVTKNSLDLATVLGGSAAVVIKALAVTDPTKMVATTALLTATAKVLQWWMTFEFQKANGCKFTNDDLSITCRNIDALAATVARTEVELREALIAFNPTFNLQLFPIEPASPRE